MWALMSLSLIVGFIFTKNIELLTIAALFAIASAINAKS